MILAHIINASFFEQIKIDSQRVDAIEEGVVFISVIKTAQ